MQHGKFQHGNYNQYYGYRNPGQQEDPRIPYLQESPHFIFILRFLALTTGDKKSVWDPQYLYADRNSALLVNTDPALDIEDQCFGSGSMWIRIELAPFDPNSVLGIRIRVRN